MFFLCFIYKFINFIVEQGRGIVTNLEHLKFFFLSRIGASAIDTYNSKYNGNDDDKNDNNDITIFIAVAVGGLLLLLILIKLIL